MRHEILFRLLGHLGKSDNLLIFGKKKEAFFRNDNDCFIDRFQYFHDGCVVRTFEVQEFGPLESGARELGHRVFGILFSSSCEPDRSRPIFRGSTEDHSRGNYADYLQYFFGGLSKRRIEVESCGRLLNDHRRRCFHF